MIIGPVNQAMFDWPWSGIHFSSGLFIGAAIGAITKRRSARHTFIIGLALLLAWELFEGVLRFLDVHYHALIIGFKQSVAGFAFGRETSLNVFGDTVIGSVGLWFGIETVRKLLART